MSGIGLDDSGRRDLGELLLGRSVLLSLLVKVLLDLALMLSPALPVLLLSLVLVLFMTVVLLMRGLLPWRSWPGVVGWSIVLRGHDILLLPADCVSLRTVFDVVGLTPAHVVWRVSSSRTCGVHLPSLH